MSLSKRICKICRRRFEAMKRRGNGNIGFSWSWTGDQKRWAKPDDDGNLSGYKDNGPFCMNVIETSDKDMWENHGLTICPYMSLHGNRWHIFVNEGPPEKCPYALEHFLDAQKTGNL